jgi:tetratricopeptide (TPR) repeat protein
MVAVLVDDDPWSGIRAEAETASAAGEWETAIKRWEALRAQFPEEVNWWLKAAEGYWHAGFVQAADDILTTAKELFPDNLWIAHWRTFVAQQMSNWPEALARAETLCQRFPSHSIGYVMLGEAYRALGRIDEAEAAFAAAVERVQRFPEDEWALRRYAELAEHRENWPAALDRWQAMLAACPRINRR